MSCSCTIEVVTTDARLAELRHVWDELVDSATVSHPFLSYEWMATWWECFGAGAELRIVIVRAGDEAIAIAPLMETRKRICGASHDCISFLANDHTPRCDFIVRRSRSDEAYEAICSFLMSESAEWDVLQLRDVPSDSPTLSELARRGEQCGFLAGVRPSVDSPLVHVMASWEDYLRTLDGKRKRVFRNRLRRL